MRDSKFRLSLPPSLKDDIAKYERNPNCPCNLDVYRNILKLGVKQLKEYYPNKEVVNPETELPPLQENHWTVINCSIHEIEEKLKNAGVGRKQIFVARYQDQATVIINDLDV
ncbi:MAG: hypothetical protein GTO02_00220 [Candidatus Dadabacteria bacterium]|nr:hypothetical protein [Candidatus Dadabacteria bacterium]